MEVGMTKNSEVLADRLRALSQVLDWDRDIHVGQTSGRDRDSFQGYSVQPRVDGDCKLGGDCEMAKGVGVIDQHDNEEFGINLCSPEEVRAFLANVGRVMTDCQGVCPGCRVNLVRIDVKTESMLTLDPFYYSPENREARLGAYQQRIDELAR